MKGKYKNCRDTGAHSDIEHLLPGKPGPFCRFLSSVFAIIPCPHSQKYAVRINQKIITNNIKCHEYYSLLTVQAAHQRDSHKPQVGKYHHETVAVYLPRQKPHHLCEQTAQDNEHQKKHGHQNQVLCYHAGTVCDFLIQYSGYDETWVKDINDNRGQALRAGL